jgi:ABC-type transporter lipoprotein component MlaA
MVTEGVNGNMDEINALDNRVLRGKIKAAIVKAKRAKT